MASLSFAEDKKAVKNIQSIYQKIESAHKEWPMASFTDLGGSERQVWRSNDETPFYRVKLLLNDDHGEVTYIYHLQGEELVFMFHDLENIPNSNDSSHRLLGPGRRWT
jgi:hypothetical protein